MTRQRRGFLATIAFIALLPMACGGEKGSGSASEAATVRDSSGVQIVENRAEGIWTAKSRWTVEKDLSIGVLGGDSNYEFGNISDIDEGRDGRIYVLDNRPVRIRVFHSDGTFAHAFGREGDGPGEFSTIPGALIVSDTGTILVTDLANRKANLFTPEGEYLASFPIERSIVWADLPGGEYLEQPPHWSRDGATKLIRRNSQGAVLDSITSLDRRAMPEQDKDGRLSLSVLSPQPLWSRTTDGRIVSGRSDFYRIEVRTRDGRLERVITKAHEDRVLSDGDRKAMVDRYINIVRRNMRRGGSTEEEIRLGLERMEYRGPERLPVLSKLKGGPQGTIWVRGVLPVDSIFEPGRSSEALWASSEWEVYSREGRLLGTVSLPPDFTLEKIRGNHLYGIETDELDVQRVVRLKIVGPLGGSDATSRGFLRIAG